MRVDNATLNFDKLMFARVLVDMKINGDYPDYISFIDENDDRPAAVAPPAEGSG